MSAFPQMMRSSEKRMEWIGGQPGPKVTLASPALSMASCNIKDSTFIARTNKYGESGQPCLIFPGCLEIPVSFSIDINREGSGRDASIQ